MEPSFLSARRERQDLIYHFRPRGKGQHKKVAGLRSSGNQFLSKQAKASEDAEKAAARAQQRADGAADLQKALGEMSEVAAAVHDSLHLSTNMFSTPLARRLRNAIRNSGLVCKLLPARKKWYSGKFVLGSSLSVCDGQGRRGRQGRDGEAPRRGPRAPKRVHKCTVCVIQVIF